MTDTTNWIDWPGGEQPVPDGTKVEVKLRDYGPTVTDYAERFNWRGTSMIRYRIAAGVSEAAKRFDPLTPIGPKPEPMEAHDDLSERIEKLIRRFENALARGKDALPKLNPYISVGFCTSYGDADYSVSMAVCDLTPAQYTELKAMCVSALACMDRHWKDAPRPSPGGQETVGRKDAA